MSELKFYTNPMSRGRIVRWMLEEVGAEYETVYLEYGASMKGDAYLAINPMGKVPAIVHGKAVVTECAAICSYLADAFPDAGLAPPLDRRADYYRWMFFAAGPLESAVIDKAMGLEPNEKQQQMAGYGSLPRVMDTLERAVSRTPFIAGDRFTAADVYVGSHIAWGLQFETIEPRPAFTDYWSRLSDREAYRRGNEIDDAAMPDDS